MARQVAEVGQSPPMARPAHSEPRVSIWDLRVGTCRWPLGGPWEPVEFFCGQPTVPGCSWCQEHRKRAFSGTAKLGGGSRLAGGARK